MLAIFRFDWKTQYADDFFFQSLCEKIDEASHAGRCAGARRPHRVNGDRREREVLEDDFDVSAFDGVVHLEKWRNADAEARHHGVIGDVRIVRFEDAVDRDLLCGAVGTLESPRACILCGRANDARVTLKIGRLLRENRACPVRASAFG